MSLVHVGIRPVKKLITWNEEFTEIRGYHYEVFEDGGYKLWSDRMLKSGCKGVISGDITEGDLIYCKYCDELFSANQFKEMNDESKSKEEREDI